MDDAMSVYFDGEKYAGLLLAGYAVAVIVAAVIMFRAGPAFRSFTVTLAVVAVAQIGLGVGLFLRTGPQVRVLREHLRVDRAAFQSAEATRMARVQRNFVVVEYVELIVIVGTAVAAVALKGRPGPAGVALGLLINASVLLAFDMFAERRGAEYVSALGEADR